MMDGVAVVHTPSRPYLENRSLDETRVGGTDALCFRSPPVGIPCNSVHKRRARLPVVELLSPCSDSANFGRAPVLHGNLGKLSTVHQSELVSRRQNSLPGSFMNLWLPETMTLAKPPIVIIDTPRPDNPPLSPERSDEFVEVKTWLLVPLQLR